MKHKVLIKRIVKVCPECDYEELFDLEDGSWLCSNCLEVIDYCDLDEQEQIIGEDYIDDSLV